MVAGRKKPTFNLKVVVQETGIKPDTIRAWERRYNLPQPDRTAGGHRLYSQYDIDTLKWLVERQHEGLSISRAVDLWNTILQEGKKPLEEMPLPAAVALDQMALSNVSGDVINEFRQAWIEACMAFDEQRAEAVLTQALARYPVEVVCVEVLQRGLVEIGDKWYSNEASVQQEHFASELATRRLETLITATPPPTRPGRIVIAGPPEENHTISLLVSTLLLRRHGWDVLYLGANVPEEQLTEMIRSTQPRLVIMGAQQLPTAGTLLDTARLVAEEEARLGFGGRIFVHLPELIEHVPGHYLGNTIDTLPERVDELMMHPPELPAPGSIPSTWHHTIEEYRCQLPQIEADIWRELGTSQIEGAHLEEANNNLAQNIVAALKYGDAALISSTLMWVKGLLEQHNIPPETLKQYFEIYRTSADRHLNADGEMLTSALHEIDLEEMF